MLAVLDRSIQAMRQKLDRQRASDNLKKNLEHRPERDELVERMFSNPPFFRLLFLDFVYVSGADWDLWTGHILPAEEKAAVGQ